MTQAINLANFANNLNTSGQVDPNALSTVVPISKGGTNATDIVTARSNLNVPTRTGGDASGTWPISITGTTPTLTTTNWTVQEVSGQLNFSYGGVLKFSMHPTAGFKSY